MSSEQELLEMLNAADPARRTTVAPPRDTAAHLIARAEEESRPTFVPRPAPPRRRFVLATAAIVAVAAIAAIAYSLPLGGPGGRNVADPSAREPLGHVVVPIAYEITTDAPPAADHLRALADNIVGAPYDTRGGRYAYRHTKYWGSSIVSQDSYDMSYVEEEEHWTAADGSGRLRRRILGVEFANEASRRFWAQVPNSAAMASPTESVEELVAGGDPPGAGANPNFAFVLPADRTQPPSDPAELAALIRAEGGALDAAKWTMELYRSYTVPRQTRAQVLEILASLDGFVWRGQVTDRAGRAGVAISVEMTPPPSAEDPHPYEAVLVFDPRTGELLAHEFGALSPHRETHAYALFLSHDRTEQLG